MVGFCTLGNLFFEGINKNENKGDFLVKWNFNFIQWNENFLANYTRPGSFPLIWKWQGGLFSEPVNVLLAFPQRRGLWQTKTILLALLSISSTQDWAFFSCILKAREHTRQKSKHHKNDGVQYGAKKMGSAWRHFCLASRGELVLCL